MEKRGRELRGPGSLQREQRLRDEKAHVHPRSSECSDMTREERTKRGVWRWS